MYLKLFLLFAIIPVIEIYLIVKIGGFLGILPTVGLLLAVSSTGAWLVRHHGFSILGRIRDEMAQGRLPSGALLEGGLILTGGILLLTPGFFTDALGLAFLFPPIRAVISRIAVRRLKAHFMKGTIVIRRSSPPGRFR